MLTWFRAICFCLWRGLGPCIALVQHIGQVFFPASRVVFSGRVSPRVVACAFFRPSATQPPFPSEKELRFAFRYRCKDELTQNCTGLVNFLQLQNPGSQLPF